MPHALRPATVRLRTLGRIDLTRDDGSDLTDLLARPKELALVAYLATESALGGYVARDTLLALFWPGKDDAHARHALRQMLYSLRQHLGPEVVQSRGAREVGLDPELVRSDVDALREAAAEGRREEVLLLYGGDFLSGFNPGDVSAGLEQWIDEVRLRLRGEAVAAARSLADSAESAGRIGPAIRYGRRAVAIDPLAEADVHRLVRLLARTESVVEALETYERYRLRLEADLDLAPGAEIQQEVQRLLEPALAAPAARGAIRPVRPVESAADTPGDRGPPDHVRRREGWRPAVVPALVIAAFVLIGGWWALLRRPESRAPIPASPRLVVAPVESADGAPGVVRLAYAAAWGLEENGGLEVVDPGTVRALLRRSGEGGVADLIRLARDKLRADLVLIGRALPDTQDIGMLELWDAAASDVPLARAAVGLPTTSRDLQMAVDTAIGLLRRRLGPGSDGDARLLPERTEALDAYILGDAYLHGGERRAAIRAFQRAVSADSAFALGWHQLSIAADLELDGALADSAVERAGRESWRLPPRVAHLIEARRAHRKGAADEAETALRALLAEHPDDAEAQQLLAEALVHFNPTRGRSPTEALPLLRQVAAAGAARPEALYHAAQLSLLAGETATFRTAVRELLSLPAARWTPRVRALEALRTPGPTAWTRELDRLASADAVDLFATARDVAVYGRSPAAAADVARLLTVASRPGQERALGFRVLADLALACGRPAEAWSFLARAKREQPASALVHQVLMATLPTVPGDAALLRDLRQRVALLEAPAAGTNPWVFPEASLYPALKDYLDGLIALEQGEPDRAARRLRALGDPADRNGARLYGLLARRYWLSTGTPTGPQTDPLASVRATAQEAALSPIFSGPDLRYLYALHVDEGGRHRLALRLLRSLEEGSIADLTLAGPARVAAAEIHEQLGERADAESLYRSALELWAGADPAYRPLIDRARDGLARVTTRSAS